MNSARVDPSPDPPSETSPDDGPSTAGGPDRQRKKRFLNIIAWVAVIDVLLLIPLIWASRWVAERDDIVGILGPTHGFLFIVLIGLCAYGSIQKWWGWWFPVLVVVTLGPLGSLIGDWIVRREMKSEGTGTTGAGNGAGVAS
jgi:hypothetical protein